MGFVLVSCYRSGGTMLQEAIDAHPELRCAGEVLHADPPVRLRECRRVGLPPSFSDPKWLSGLGPRTGVKITYEQLFQWPHRQDGLKGLSILHLTRNPLRCVLSSREARARNVWHWRDGSAPPEVGPQLLPLRWLEQQLERIEGQRQAVRELAGRDRYLEVTYEDWERDSARVWTRVCEFLGVRTAAARWKTRKLGRGCLAVRIRNYDWIRENLGPQWRHCLGSAHGDFGDGLPRLR